MPLPNSILISFLALMAGILWLIYRGMTQLMERAAIDGPKRKRVLILAFGGILGWLSFLAIVAKIGFFADFSNFPPRVPVALIPPVIVGILLLRNATVKKILQHTPPGWLIYPQAFRFPLELILWGMLITGVGPVQMTFEVYNFDIITGITAPIVAWLVFQRATLSRRFAIAWNFMGLTFIVIVLTIAVLSFPNDTLRYFMDEPSTRVVAYWPIIWLPGFVVPFAVWLHLLSLKQLLTQKAQLNEAL